MFSLLALAMSLQLFKMRRDYFFIFVCLFCAVPYAMEFFAWDCKLVLTDANSSDIHITNFMFVVDYLSLMCEIIGHYLLIATYFKYSMFLSITFMSPSEEKTRLLF